MLERLADLTRAQDVKVGFEANPDMLSISGTTLDQFANMMEGLGFAVEKGERDKVKPEPKEGEDAKPVAEDEETTEVFYTFKWVPKARPVRPETTQKPRAKGKPAGGKPKRHTAAPVKKEKPLDPDNPFAALMALKGKS